MIPSYKDSRPQSAMQTFDDNEIDGIRESLISWYNLNRRKLPWRGDNLPNNMETPKLTAYGVWVSEIMLQQTRVETVISYWYKWMERFPTVESLASSSLDDVNAMWAGLGYYRRANFLLKGAKKIVDEYDGKIPDTAKRLECIPGIGPYTAGAIASIAYNECAPLVDGNVIRVLSRLRRLETPISPKLEKECWDLARGLVDIHHPGDFNQAMMELGAMICKPTSPLCHDCPIQDYCNVRKGSELSSLADNCSNKDLFDIEDFPRKAPKKRPREVIISVCVLSTQSKFTSTNNTNLDLYHCIFYLKN